MILLKKIISFHLLLLLSTSLYAQFQVSSRTELPIKRQQEDDFEIIPLDEKGLILVSVAEPWNYAKNKEFKISYFNTKLEVVKTKIYLLPYEFVRDRQTYYDEDRYLYFFSQDKSNLEVSIFRLDIFNTEGTLYRFAPPVKMSIESFNAIDDFAYMVGDYSGKPVGISFNFINQTPRVLPSFYDDRETINFIQVDQESNEIYFIVKNNSLGPCQLLIKPYSQLIGSQKAISLDRKGDRTLQRGLVSTTKERDKLIIGTYSLKCSKNPQGIYITRHRQGERKNVNFIRFTDLSNFFSHYGEKKEIRYKKRIESKRKKGKEMNLSRKIELHPELYLQKNQKVVIFEGYYSTYQSASNNLDPLSFNGRNTYLYNNSFFGRNNYPWLQRNRPQNLSYQYNYAILCGFDQKGRKIWDNAMKIEQVEKNYRGPVVHLGSTGDSLITAYMHDWDIYSKMFFRYNNIQDEFKQESKNLLEEYEVTDNNWGEFIHWYDNHYLFFGEQRVKNRRESEDFYGNKVFHLTKMTYVYQPEIKSAMEEGQKGKEKKKSEKKENPKNEKAVKNR